MNKKRIAGCIYIGNMLDITFVTFNQNIMWNNCLTIFSRMGDMYYQLPHKFVKLIFTRIPLNNPVFRD
jgi:hypothetical protein